MKLKSLATALAGVFAASVAYAGTDAGKEVCVMEEPLGATLSAGYMTNYVFYGVDLGEHGIWTSVDYTIDAMGIPVDVGVCYINPADGFANDELDVYASVTQEFAGFDVTTGVVGYFFPESGADATYELALGLGRSLGVVDWNGTARYDFELQAWVLRHRHQQGIRPVRLDLAGDQHRYRLPDRLLGRRQRVQRRLREGRPSDRPSFECYP